MTASCAPKKIETVLKGSKYTLVPFNYDHITDRYIEWLNSPKINQYLEVRLVHQTRATVQRYVQFFVDNPNDYMWAIILNETNETIGTVALRGINFFHGTGELGLLIGEPECWGQNASEESLKLVIEFSFTVLGLRRLGAGTYAPNLGMNFTFKKLKFNLEGKLKQTYFLEPGKYADGYRWGLLADDWKKQNVR